MLALLILLELVGRLSLVAAILAVPRSSHVAAALAIGAAIAGAIRSIAKGALVASETERAWAELAAGVRRTDLATLAAHRGDVQHVSTMIDSVREISVFRATGIAEVAADALALAAVLVFAFLKLPLFASAIVLAGLALGAVVSRLGRRAQRRAQSVAFAEFAVVARDAEALVEAGLELRAHGAERAHSARLLAAVHRMCAAERRSYQLSAASAALPSVLALALVITPNDVLRDLAERVGWLDLGVVGATGLALVTSLARGVDGIARSSVHRALFARLAADPAAAPTVAVDAQRPLEPIAFAGVSVRRGDAARATPRELSFGLASGGLALAGENGVGKTSALLALLGFVEPTSGAVTLGGDRASAADFERIRARVAFLPQRCFVAPAETLRFHALLAGVDDEESLRRSCHRVGLDAVIARAGLDASMGTLSGGERQRFFLARALARGADILVLDEPEAGLDGSQRTRLAEILAEEASARRVIVVAHDPAVIPPGFARIQCEAC